jgi:hypothetical protein
VGSIGDVYCPVYNANGSWDFCKFQRITVSVDNDSKNRPFKHFMSLPGLTQTLLKEYFKEIEIPIGDKKKPGIINNCYWRAIANVKFFLRLEEQLNSCGPRLFKHRTRSLIA